VVPEETDPQRRFREVPSAIAPAISGGERWTHIAIDEAQDLCVAEASLIGSLVDPDGALIVLQFCTLHAAVKRVTRGDQLAILDFAAVGSEMRSPRRR
jgi:hypothetical protein